MGCLYDSIDAPIIGTGFGLDEFAEQTEEREENCLECCFVLLMHVVWNSCKEYLYKLA
jgi:hypothetical protein